MKKIIILLLFYAINLQPMNLNVRSMNLQRKRTNAHLALNKQTSMQRNFTQTSRITNNIAKSLSQFTNKPQDSRASLYLENRYSLLKNSNDVFDGKRKICHFCDIPELLEYQQVMGILLQEKIIWATALEIRESELIENYEKHTAQFEKEMENLAKENKRISEILKNLKESVRDKEFAITVLSEELDRVREKNKELHKDLQSPRSNRITYGPAPKMP